MTIDAAMITALRNAADMLLRIPELESRLAEALIVNKQADNQLQQAHAERDAAVKKMADVTELIGRLQEWLNGNYDCTAPGADGAAAQNGADSTADPPQHVSDGQFDDLERRAADFLQWCYRRTPSMPPDPRTFRARG
jgi:hypothetical protein